MELIADQPMPVIVDYPSLSDRIQSSFIDILFIILMMSMLSSLFEHFENVPDWINIACFFGLWLVYEPLCVALGCTIGNFIKRIRVRQYKDTTKRINIVQALIRYLIKLPLGWLSFLTIHSNPQKRAIHDLVAGSVVIKK